MPGNRARVSKPIEITKGVFACHQQRKKDRDADYLERLERLGTERRNGTFETAATVGTGLKITLNL
jgi:hypothetical protein